MAARMLSKTTEQVIKKEVEFLKKKKNAEVYGLPQPDQD